MGSLGSNAHTEKFYKGAASDTPWNKDLLWRYYVAKEEFQSKVSSGEIPKPDSNNYSKYQRKRMGITGALIPELTARNVLNSGVKEEQKCNLSGRRTARSQSSASTSGSKKHSSSHSQLSSCSSHQSLKLQDIQDLIDSHGRQDTEKSLNEIAKIRLELQEEARKRQIAEEKLQKICEKLGLSD